METDFKNISFNADDVCSLILSVDNKTLMLSVSPILTRNTISK